MNRQEFEAIMATYKKGAYIKMVWETISKNGRKVSTGVVRFTSKDIMVSKSGTEYTTARITKSPKHHTKVVYFNERGVECTKSEYESKNPSYVIVDFFAKRLENIISLG